MATLAKIEKAVHEKREFYWEYSETQGYVLRGRLPWHTKTKVICATRNWKEADTISRKWLVEKFGRHDQRQQLVTLINQNEDPTQSPSKPTHKVVDDSTLDLFTDNQGGNN
jgi:hypothetical protein